MNPRVAAHGVPVHGGDTGPPIRLGRRAVLKGCNVYHTRSAIRQSADFGSLAGRDGAKTRAMRSSRNLAVQRSAAQRIQVGIA